MTQAGELLKEDKIEAQYEAAASAEQNNQARPGHVNERQGPNQLEQSHSQGMPNAHSPVIQSSGQRPGPSEAMPGHVRRASSPTVPQDSTFLQSLTASVSRAPEQGAQLAPERRKQHASRIPLHPLNSLHDDNSSGMGLERLASLRMDSGDLNDTRHGIPPYGHAHPGPRPVPEPYGQRYSPWDPSGRDGMHPAMMPRQMMYEDEVSGPGMYGPPYYHPEHMRGPPMGLVMSDPYLARQMGHVQGPSRGRMQHLMHHHSVQDFSSYDPQLSDNIREGQRWQPATPNKSGLHRSQSEGLPLLPPGGKPPGASSGERAQGNPESSNTSGKSAPKEPSSSVRAGNLQESPDFAMIYAFLGSMFDPVCHMINHADVMQQMAPVDRETTVLILENCVHNLDTPYFLESYLQQIRMIGTGGAARPHPPPPVLSRDSSEYDVATRHDPSRGPLP